MSRTTIKQIAIAQSSNDDSENYTLVALCSDDSLWWHGLDGGQWHLIEPVPGSGADADVEVR